MTEPEGRAGPVLGVFAHPDDAEIAAGGVLAKWAAAGREVHLLVLTNGDRVTSRFTAPIRFTTPSRPTGVSTTVSPRPGLAAGKLPGRTIRGSSSRYG